MITDDFLPPSDSHVKAIYNTAHITAREMKRMVTNDPYALILHLIHIMSAFLNEGRKQTKAKMKEGMNEGTSEEIKE